MKIKRKQLIKILLFSLVIILAVLFYGFKAYAPTGAIVLIRTTYGGMCATPGGRGGGEVCHNEIELYSNGNFGDKHLSRDQVAKVKELIKETDFNSYTKRENPDCPSYSDGSDVGYKFPSKTGDKTFTLCQLNIPENDPLFSYLSTLQKSKL